MPVGTGPAVGPGAIIRDLPEDQRLGFGHRQGEPLRSGEGGSKAIDREPPCAHFPERGHDLPHHPPDKRGRDDLDPGSLGGLFQCDMVDRPDRGEIGSKPPSERPHIDRTLKERGGVAPPVDRLRPTGVEVPIGPAHRQTDAERGIDLGRCGEEEVGREAVQCPEQGAGSEIRIEGQRVRSGAYAAIGPARDLEARAPISGREASPKKARANLSLDGPPPGLSRPALVAGAVVAELNEPAGRALPKAPDLKESRWDEG